MDFLFGMLMPERKYQASAASSYRYGFNGKEKSNEVYGEGNVYDYGFRVYNPRIGKFLSVDPLKTEFPYYTPYQFAGNIPIAAIDLDGLEQYVVIYFKDQKDGDPYKVQIRTMKSDKVLVNQNVQKIIPGTNETDGERVSKGSNVLVFEVYREGTTKEQIKVVDRRNKLSPNENNVLNNNNKALKSNDTQFAYPFSDGKEKYESQEFGKPKFFIAEKLLNQPPPQIEIRAKFINGSSKLEDEAAVFKNLEQTVKYLNENPNMVLKVEGNSSRNLPDNTPVTMDGKESTVKNMRIERANIIRDLLIKGGVNPTQVKAQAGNYIHTDIGDPVPTSFKFEKIK